MSRIQLRSGDIALLGRLNRTPLEIGLIPAETVTRLTALGLAKKVLGCLEITRAGQLSYQRNQFLKASRGRIARVTRRHPMFLHEARFHGPVSRSSLMDFIRQRRAAESRTSYGWFVPKWLTRLASRKPGDADEAKQVAAGAGAETVS